jgi:Tol biopolymer transport system component
MPAKIILTSVLGLTLLSACSKPAEQDPAATESQSTMGIFETTTDLGIVSQPGVFKYNSKADSYSLTASGANIWGDRDDALFVSKPFSGNISFSANIDFVGEGVDPHRKAGLMIRQSLAADSPYIDVIVHGDGLTSLQYRDVAGGQTKELASNVKAPKALKIELIDGYAYLSVKDGTDQWVKASGSVKTDITAPYHIGMVLSAHNNDVTETAIFSNLKLEAPDLPIVEDTGYGATVDSALEIIKIDDGNRRLVRYFDDKKEAPNWSRDGKFLVYNGNGLLYKIPVEGGTPEQINTGPLKKMNNDHGISPDGTELVVSDQTQEDNLSRMYILPIEGSDNPRLVAEDKVGNSYWHAWSPKDGTLVYTANREAFDGDYNLYGISDKGGKEFPLTTEKGLDDGADYSHDGEYIYFNSVRSGHMNLWRIDADGANPKQITFSEKYRDWFPHPSPDGKWIAFISFGLDIDVTDHPPNREVVLRIMPTDGSEEPRILTRLFGGQGTFNVPAWSPDSKEIAFVSYRLDR